MFANCPKLHKKKFNILTAGMKKKYEMKNVFSIENNDDNESKCEKLTLYLKGTFVGKEIYCKSFEAFFRSRHLSRQTHLYLLGEL